MIIEVNHPHFGEVAYDEKGKPVCHICGKSFKKVLTHVWQKHNISALEYKQMFGLDIHKGILCEETREKHREATLRNAELVIEENLKNKGSKTRFRKGGKGRTRDLVSEQTRKMLLERIDSILSQRKNKIKKNT